MCTQIGKECTYPEVAPYTAESPARKKKMWSPEEYNLIVKLRDSGMEWGAVSERMRGGGFIRSPGACRVRKLPTRIGRYITHNTKLPCWNHGCKGKMFANLTRHQTLMGSGLRRCISCRERKTKCDGQQTCSCCLKAKKYRKCIYETETEAICPKVCIIRPRWSPGVEQAVGG